MNNYKSRVLRSNKRNLHREKGLRRTRRENKKRKLSFRRKIRKQQVPSIRGKTLTIGDFNRAKMELHNFKSLSRKNKRKQTRKQTRRKRR